jgi:hypothetical protein
MKVSVTVPAMLLAWAGMTAMAAQRDYSYSTRYTLHPGDPGYGKLVAWIHAKHIEQQKAGTTGTPPPESGTITVEIKSAAHTTPGTGATASPGSLPTTGTPGEQYTVTLSTPTSYETWTYAWTANAHGTNAPGWLRTTYQTSLCTDNDAQSNEGVGAHCAP